MVTNGKVLILYASLTGNTEKIATWFKESFEHYNFHTTMFKMTTDADWRGMQERLYFDDYDIVCLGSLIIAGAPSMIVTKALSLGGGGVLENSLGSGAPKGNPPDAAPQEFFARWRRKQAPYMGVLPKNDYQPLGIVFTTYGGGFYGSDECIATLEVLKLYLETNDVKVIGKFACCGREFGPAGLADGEIPKSSDQSMNDEVKSAIFRKPKQYQDADGNIHIGSFFFHTHMNDKPGPRDEMKAKALVADIVEDYFFSYDGERKYVGSQYISIS